MKAWWNRIWRGFWGAPTKWEIQRAEEKQARREAKLEARALAEEEAASQPVAVLICPMCNAGEFRTRKQQSASGCVIGLLLLVVAAALFWAVGMLSAMAVAAQMPWLAWSAWGVWVVLLLVALKEAGRTDKFRCCKNCGYSFPVK